MMCATSPLHGLFFAAYEAIRSNRHRTDTANASKDLCDLHLTLEMLFHMASSCVHMKWIHLTNTEPWSCHYEKMKDPCRLALRFFRPGNGVHSTLMGCVCATQDMYLSNKRVYGGRVKNRIVWPWFWLCDLEFVHVTSPPQGLHCVKSKVKKLYKHEATIGKGIRYSQNQL